jgi:small subunit ribosomal protein S18
LLSYREIELLRKFMTPSSKIMSRKRAGTTAQEQAAIKTAVKHARFLALVPYAGN